MVPTATESEVGALDPRIESELRAFGPMKESKLGAFGPRTESAVGVVIPSGTESEVGCKTTLSLNIRISKYQHCTSNAI
jgi:hypothetical protein